MAAEPPRWRFWDFGTLQFVQDGLTGDSLRVHGPGAAFEDGPFRFVDDDKPVVVGLTGTDDFKASFNGKLSA